MTASPADPFLAIGRLHYWRALCVSAEMFDGVHLSELRIGGLKHLLELPRFTAETLALVVLQLLLCPLHLLQHLIALCRVRNLRGTSDARKMHLAETVTRTSTS